jgi:aconitate hydratase
MAPEYGATCGFFPVDDETLRYLRHVRPREDRVALVEAYAKAQGMWRTRRRRSGLHRHAELDLGDVVPSLAGPKRPQDRVPLTASPPAFAKRHGRTEYKKAPTRRALAVEGKDFDLGHGDVVIAAITSCTNTSNPGADRRRPVARKAVSSG